MGETPVATKGWVEQLLKVLSVAPGQSYHLNPTWVIPQPAIVAWGVLFVVALAVTGKYDEPISQAVADPTCSWAEKLEKYGEIPGYLTSAVGAAIVLATNKNPRAPGGEYDRTTLVVTAVCLGFLCVRFTAVVYKGSQVLPDQLSTPVATVIAVAIIGYARSPTCCAARCVRARADTACFGARRSMLGHTVYARDPASRAQLVARLHVWRALGLSMFLLSFVGSVVSYAIKGLWGRARPYMVLPAECLDEATTCGYSGWPNEPSESCLDYVGVSDEPQYLCKFTGWWHPNGPRTHLTSFPSGHTFEGWLLLPLALHFAEMPHSSPPPLAAKVAVWVTVVSWGVAVGLSRVFLGKVRVHARPPYPGWYDALCVLE